MHVCSYRPAHKSKQTFIHLNKNELCKKKVLSEEATGVKACIYAEPSVDLCCRLRCLCV